ncbi:MAG: ROK family transcriptional regulator [Chloroflexota bacterium]
MNQPLEKSTHQQTKANNVQLVLRTIYDHGQISRAQVARLTRLTRVTVSEIVTELIESKLVAEVGRGPSTGGKTPILLSVIDDARHLICLDLEDEVFHGAVINLRGQIKYSCNLSRQDQGGAQAVEMVYELVDSLLAATRQPVLGIGVGVPGLVDSVNGVVRRAVHLDWNDLHLANLLDQRYHLPVHIANDSQAAALAEFTFGKHEQLNNILVVRVGRGIGAGMVLNGRLHYGDNFGAGEIGHMRVVEGGERCRCGNYGCLETVASSRALVRRAQFLLDELPGGRLASPLRRMAARPEDIDTDLLLRAYRAGDRTVRGLIEDVGYYLGMAIAHMVSILNVNQVVLTGSLSRFGDVLVEVIRYQLLRGGLPLLADKVQVSLSTLGKDIVMLGAASLLMGEVGLV